MTVPHSITPHLHVVSHGSKLLPSLVQHVGKNIIFGIQFLDALVSPLHDALLVSLELHFHGGHGAGHLVDVLLLTHNGGGHSAKDVLHILCVGD